MVSFFARDPSEMKSPEQSASSAFLMQGTISERNTTEQSNSSQEPQPCTSSATPQASLSSEIQKLQELQNCLKGKHSENIILQENLQHSEERGGKSKEIRNYFTKVFNFKAGSMFSLR